MRRTNNQIVADRRKMLNNSLNDNRHLLDTLDPKERDQFRSNILEFATQDYLLAVIEPKEIIRFAVSVTKTGLDIAPSAKEVYIVPFDTKVQNPQKPGDKVKVMLPQAIIPLNGAQQLAYDQQFFLKMDAVYRFDDGTDGSDATLSRAQQAQLKTTDPEWVNKHFIGFDVTLQDLKGELPYQTRFVELAYLQEATKTIKDNRWKLQTYRHKAVRRAMGDFMIPRSRKVEALEKLEHLNEKQMQKADAIDAQAAPHSDKSFAELEKAVQQLGLGLEDKNGMAVVTGKSFAQAKTLKELGFAFKDNEWAVQCEPGQKSLKKEPQRDYSMELFHFLKNNGLTKDQIAGFAKDRGITRDKPDVIKAALEDKEKLLDDAKAFLQPGGQEDPNEVF